MENKKGINVLSLFDGISCGRIGLERVGIEVNNYYASEIDEYAIKISNKNYPDIKHIGNIININGSDYNNIDLIIGGSPCQNLSMAVVNNIKHNKGLSGEKSSLFYEYLRVLHEVKPKYFILENVGGMTNENKKIISNALECEPIEINSNLVSAQDRSRLYWTNIPNVSYPKDKGLVLRDIALATDEIPDKAWYDKPFIYHGDEDKIQATLEIKGHDILKRVYNLNNKCGTLTRCGGGNQEKKVYQNGKCRKLLPIEYERLQTIPDNYTEGVSDSQRYNMLGNAWTVDVIVEFFKNINK